MELSRAADGSSSLPHGRANLLIAGSCNITGMVPCGAIASGPADVEMGKKGIQANWLRQAGKSKPGKRPGFLLLFWFRFLWPGKQQNMSPAALVVYFIPTGDKICCFIQKHGSPHTVLGLLESSRTVDNYPWTILFFVFSTIVRACGQRSLRSHKAGAPFPVLF